jgi:hypothetical protein
MPALGAGIHVLFCSKIKDVDGRGVSAFTRVFRRAMPGHDAKRVESIQCWFRRLFEALCEVGTLKSDSADQRLALDLFRVTAARMSVLNAVSLILSPSWKSMARLVLPSRLELKRRDRSSSAAPLAKVIFTTLL